MLAGERVESPYVGERGFLAGYLLSGPSKGVSTHLLTWHVTSAAGVMVVVVYTDGAKERV